MACEAVDIFRRGMGEVMLGREAGWLAGWLGRGLAASLRMLLGLQFHERLFCRWRPFARR